MRRPFQVAFAVALGTTVGLIPWPGLPPDCRRAAGLAATVLVLWISEGLPLPITALLVPAGAIMLRLGAPQSLFSTFGDPVLFLFIGSFILSQAVAIHGLDRRIVGVVLSRIGDRATPFRLLLGFGAVCAFLSFWISNTTVTILMLPLGLNLARTVNECREDTGVSGEVSRRAYATAMVLMAAWSPAAGGLATPVGTPPNLIGLAALRRFAGTDILFLDWCRLALPLVFLLFLFLLLELRLALPFENLSHGPVKLESWKPEPLSRAQWSVGAGCIFTVAFWILPELLSLLPPPIGPAFRAVKEAMPESVVAICGAALLFVLPGNEPGSAAMTWKEAETIDWGTVLLFGGGVALGSLFFSTGLAGIIGKGLSPHLIGAGSFGRVLLFVSLATLVSEMASNTASASIVVPMAITVAQSIGADPALLALSATMGSSLGFILPISTPSNAIAYSTGFVSSRQMFLLGLTLDVCGALILSLGIWCLFPLVW